MTSHELKSSSDRIGQLYPILVDYYGNIIDGEHRFSADQNWRRVRLEHIKTEKDRLVARIISNTHRRSVSSKEKMELLNRLGEIYQSKGIDPGKIAYKMVNETGMSYRWVAKYLPDRFKNSLQSERRKNSVARPATTSITFTDPPEDVLNISVYRNTDFVNFVVKKSLYEKLEEKAKKMEITPTKLIYNALLLILKTNLNHRARNFKISSDGLFTIE
ncbi:ParB/RepB/Spo0J family partition protein [Candidatus Bathyarchaeota archaeon]|nr:ParB/RepB/Spo0J family partition protein [Candidatus Bathyarchaeota archaeon]